MTELPSGRMITNIADLTSETLLDPLLNSAMKTKKMNILVVNIFKQVGSEKG